MPTTWIEFMKSEMKNKPKGVHASTYMKEIGKKWQLQKKKKPTTTTSSTQTEPEKVSISVQTEPYVPSLPKLMNKSRNTDFLIARSRPSIKPHVMLSPYDRPLYITNPGITCNSRS